MSEHLPLPNFKAIAAMSLNRVIGRGNEIPWHLPEDLKWFKKLTMGHTIVMGRKTFESIGRPLPGRTTIVLTRSAAPIQGVTLISTIDDLSKLTGQVFICGGAQIYEQTLGLCSELFLTLVKREVAGDAYFLPFEHLFAPAETIVDAADYSITRFRNLSSSR